MQEIERVEAYSDLDYYPRRVEMSGMSWLVVARNILISDRNTIVELAEGYRLEEYIDDPKRILAERFSDIWHQIRGASRDRLSFWIEIMPYEHELIKQVALENTEFGQSDEFAEYEQYYNREARILERLRAEKERVKKTGW